MAEDTTVKKTSRTKKANSSPEPSNAVAPLQVGTAVRSEQFTNLINSISQAQTEFESLQREIAETRKAWTKEQQEHQVKILELNQADELRRKREQETHAYENARQHKQVEDEFADRKAAWEKQLRDQQEVIAKEKKELEELRKAALSFEGEKEKAVKAALDALQKQLTAQFDTEKRLREQEVKSERDILTLRMETLKAESTRQTQEIQTLRLALDEASRQVKDIAVKVIESGNTSKAASSQEIPLR